MVNGKQHSVWFVPTGMKGLPQNVLLNFRLEFPKSDLTIYLPSGISEIFCQMVRTPGQFRHCWARQIRHKQRISHFEGHKSIYSKKQKCSLFARLCHILFHVARIQISHWPCLQRVIIFCSFILCVYLSELAKQDNAFIAQ